MLEKDDYQSKYPYTRKFAEQNIMNIDMVIEDENMDHNHVNIEKEDKVPNLEGIEEETIKDKNGIIINGKIIQDIVQ